MLRGISFVGDDCDMLILLYDGGFYEIYVKDESLSENMYKRYAREDFDKLECLDEDNFHRTIMHF